MEMVVPEGLDGVLSVDPEIMHGDLCFVGTRVPLTVFLDNMTEGMGLDDFVTYYPSVNRSQVSAILLWEQNKLRQAAGLPQAS